MNIIPDLVLHSVELSDGDIIADFGCGVGYYIDNMAKKVAPSGHIIAVDVNQDILDTCSSNAARCGCTHNVSFEQCDLGHDHLGCERGSIDYVFIITTLFQIPNKLNVFKEANRILKDRGEIVIVDWTDSFGGIGPNEEFIFPKSDAWKMSLDNGFKSMKSFDVGEYHYGIKGIKV